MKNGIRVLVYGYGNPGRRDDGLGPALVEKLEKYLETSFLPGITVDSNYQLNIEDAYTMKDYDLVIFADATVEDIDHFILTRVTADPKTSFSMHSVSPAYLVHLCRELYNKTPEVFLLHLKGYEFDLKEGLSVNAENNMGLSFQFLLDILNNPDPIHEQGNELSIGIYPNVSVGHIFPQQAGENLPGRQAGLAKNFSTAEPECDGGLNETKIF